MGGFDSVSPEGGYDGPDSETEAAKGSMHELPAPSFDAPAAEEPEPKRRSKK